MISNNKFVNAIEWAFEKGLIQDKSNTRQCQNVIRWIKRNLNIGNNLVCVRRGVYEAELSVIERAYSAHKNRCLQTSEDRRLVMIKINAERKAKKIKNP
jgi:hypothetical protein